MMPKGDTVEAIMKMNPSATPEFLAEFTHDELARYLKRLQNLPTPMAYDDSPRIMAPQAAAARGLSPAPHAA